MGFLNRELEVKILVRNKDDGISPSQSSVCAFVESELKKIYPAYNTEDDQIIGNATDIYWNAPRTGIGDFVRLRKTSKGGQITLKATDKGSNLDRVEIDLEVHDYKQAKELMLALHGESKASVRKKYNVFFLENEFTNVSVYRVSGSAMTFIEVEAKNKTRLKEIVKVLTKESEKWDFSWVQSSIYEMFVNNNSPKLVDLSLLT